MNNNYVITIYPPIYDNDNGWIFPRQMINNIPYNVLSYSTIYLLISIDAGKLVYTMYGLVYLVNIENVTT